MKRYDIHIERVVVGNGVSYATTVPRENPSGEYVLYSDVQSLRAERDRLNASLAEAKAERDKLREALKSLYDACPADYVSHHALSIARKVLEGEGK